jgi:hypothetical protein
VPSPFVAALGACAERLRYPHGRAVCFHGFLTAFLEDGPRPTLDIWQAAQEQDLGKRTLQRVAAS